MQAEAAHLVLGAKCVGRWETEEKEIAELISDHHTVPHAAVQRNRYLIWHFIQKKKGENQYS